jgi:hypothetical protein
MQQNFAQSQYFPINVLRFHKINAQLRLAKNSQILKYYLKKRRFIIYVICNMLSWDKLIFKTWIKS